MMKNYLTPIFTFILAFTGISAFSQVTTGDDDGSSGTLRSQIAAAAAGSTISIDSSVQAITLAGSEIVIDKSLTITGLSEAATIIDADALSRIFNITNGDLTLNHVALQNGNAADGGGILLANATLTLNDCGISDCVASGPDGSGGAIFASAGTTVSMSSTTITSNRANRSGGGIEAAAGCTITLLSSNVTDNNAGMLPLIGTPGNGGGIHLTGNANLTVTGGQLQNNVAGKQGGALWTDSGVINISQCTISDNSSDGADLGDGGGAIYNAAGSITITECAVNNNLAFGANSSGGAIHTAGGSVSLNTCQVNSNSANRSGGAIEISGGDFAVNQSTFDDNDADTAAGVPNPGNGGAIHAAGDGMVFITSSRFSANNAANNGGAIWNQSSSMTIQNSTIDNNGAAIGGGIYNNGGGIQIYQSTISNNSADAQNGGGFAIGGGTATLQVSTVSGNTSASNGGGIYNNASLALNAVTVSNNTSQVSGGGISNASSLAVSLKNSIIADNDALTGVDLSNSGAGFSSAGYNLVGFDDNDVFLPVLGDIQNQDALLAPLADNGGPTLTHALLNNSPAYNAGNPADQFNDQRNLAVFGGIRDIGAYESQTVLATRSFAETAAHSQVYPNPSNTGKIAIKMASVFKGKVSVNVIDAASGRTIISSFKVTDQSPIDVSALAAGMYILTLSTELHTENLKVIIK